MEQRKYVISNMKIYAWPAAFDLANVSSLIILPGIFEFKEEQKIASNSGNPDQ